jgi:hypothetical protein
MGRLRVWVPGLDGEEPPVERLPWARYVSPLAGHAVDYPGGAVGKETAGPSSYGFWMVPKVGAMVVVGCLYDDPNQRFVLGSYFPEHGNRSLPAGRNTPAGPTSDSGEKMEPAVSSLQAQFGGNLSAAEAQTRGAYERQVAQPKTEKDGTEGYQQDVKAGGYDPQTYCITTPGRHSIIMQDNSVTGRIRIKTAEGHQVILDDANERIYVSTAKGQTWIELDQDGRVHVYAGGDISMSTGGNFNLSAKGNVAVAAGGNIDLGATGYVHISGGKDLALNGDTGLNATSGAVLNILATGLLVASGSAIQLNGPPAAKADCAIAPEVVPTHEPWTRAASKVTRGKNWRA